MVTKLVSRYNILSLKPKMTKTIVVAGKGGVGKTLLAGWLARAFADHGNKVIAIDADPDGNLASTLGFPHPEQ